VSRHMEVSIQEAAGYSHYKSPKHAQVWFLFRSRRTWKQKYMKLKAEIKRMRNNVADARRSREKARLEAEAQRQRADALEAEVKRLREQAGRGEKRWTAGV
jgi:chromosome segregation ATPase